MSFGFANGLKLPRAIVVTQDRMDDMKREIAIAAHAKRLALELECLLLSCDTAATSKWWESAHQALEDYRAEVDRQYPQDHVSPLGKD